MLPNKANCYSDGYEGCDGDEPKGCSDGASGLSCIEYDYQMVCPLKTARTTGHSVWRVGGEKCAGKWCSTGVI
jgi:hypothetical protein